MNTLNPMAPALPPRSSPSSPTPRPRRLILIALAALFFLPFLIGSALFWSGWRPTSLVQHGELIVPPRPLPASGLQGLDGRPFGRDEFNGKWLIVVVTKQACAGACARTLEGAAAVHEALGKEAGRVRRVLVASGSAPDRDRLAEIERRSQGLAVLTLAPGAEAGWRSALAGNESELFIVDPFGNVMMRYREADEVGGAMHGAMHGEAHAEAQDETRGHAAKELRGLLQDLQRLLKYAWVRQGNQ